MTLHGVMAVGGEGMVEVAIEPRSGAPISGRAVWRVDEGPDGPILHIDPTMKIEGGARKIRPNEYLLDTATGAAAEWFGRTPYRSVRWQFAGRLTAPTAPK